MTPKQRAQMRQRVALGCLYALGSSEWSVHPEDAADWEHLEEARVRIIARAKQRSIIRQLRTRTGKLRYPAWASVNGVDHAFAGGMSLCSRECPWPQTPDEQRKGTVDEQPHVDEPCPDRCCSYCLGAALVGGVLRGQNGREATLRRQPFIPSGAHPRWFLAGELLTMRCGTQRAQVPREPRNMSVPEWLEIEVLPADGSAPFENSVPVSEIDGFEVLLLLRFGVGLMDGLTTRDDADTEDP